MKSKLKKPRVYVQVSAIWGNDDAESTIRLSRRCWKEIQDGLSFDKYTYAYYEGKRFYVRWEFIDGNVTIHGDDGRECICDYPVSELYTLLIP